MRELLQLLSRIFCGTLPPGAVYVDLKVDSPVISNVNQRLPHWWTYTSLDAARLFSHKKTGWHPSIILIRSAIIPKLSH